jgi:NADP-dependent 3-hydroxy acid dehydrogenase YdfG
MSSIHAFATEMKKKYDHIDILVNNAGFIALNRQETSLTFHPAHHSSHGFSSAHIPLQ